MGLKLRTKINAAQARGRFQTNPRGVEAVGIDGDAGGRDCFRRTLVGLKLAAEIKVNDRAERFRRTLVGLKPANQRPERTHVEFQTNPRGVEATFQQALLI